MNRLLAALASLALGLVSTAAAQTGLLVVAHGASPGWNARVEALVGQVRWAHGPVATAWLMGPAAMEAGWDPAVARLVAQGAQEIVVVPLMVSSAGSHTRQVRFYAGELAELPAELAGHNHRHHDGPPPVPMRVAPALDDAPELGLALLERWRTFEAADRARPLVLVAHGPNDELDAAQWLRDLEAATRVLCRAGHEGESHIALMRDDAPAPVRAAAVGALREKISALAAAAGDSVLVLPVLVSTGSVDTAKLPADLEGLPVRYRKAPLADSPEIARWVERVAEDARARAVAGR